MIHARRDKTQITEYGNFHDIDIYGHLETRANTGSGRAIRNQVGIAKEQIDTRWMEYALGLAERAAEQDEVPVGAVVVRDDVLLGEGWNRPISTSDPTAHAEIVALRAAARALGNYRLTGATLYVTLEPCLMCAGAMIHARIERLVFGASDPKRGAVSSTSHVFETQGLNHRVQTEGGIMSEPCGRRLQAFFQERRS